jgi:putative FmdB family regulatory protein
MSQSVKKLTRATRETYNSSVPLYEFQCPKCGHRFERIQKFSDSDPKKCPQCGAGKLKRLLHAPAVQFKGTGWYVTDYARKGGGAEASRKEGHAAESSTASAKEKGEPKPKSEHKKK